MTILDQILEIVAALDPDAQRHVLAVATRLQGARRPPDLVVPPGGAGDAAWDALCDRVQARSTIVLAEEKQRLMELGLIDESGSIVTDELPPDMRSSSQTSVDT